MSNPSFDEIMAEAQAQAAGAASLARWNDLIAAAERLAAVAPLAATKILNAVASAGAAYVGNPALGVAVQRLTDAALNRLGEVAD